MTTDCLLIGASDVQLLYSLIHHNLLCHSTLPSTLGPWHFEWSLRLSTYNPEQEMVIISEPTAFSWASFQDDPRVTLQHSYSPSIMNFSLGANICTDHRTWRSSPAQKRVGPLPRGLLIAKSWRSQLHYTRGTMLLSNTHYEIPQATSERIST